MRTKGKGKGKGKHIIDQVIHVYRKRLAESAGLVSPAVAADETTLAIYLYVEISSHWALWLFGTVLFGRHKC